MESLRKTGLVSTVGRPHLASQTYAWFRTTTTHTHTPLPHTHLHTHTFNTPLPHTHVFAPHIHLQLNHMEQRCFHGGGQASFMYGRKMTCGSMGTQSKFRLCCNILKVGRLEGHKSLARRRLRAVARAFTYTTTHTSGLVGRMPPRAWFSVSREEPSSVCKEKENMSFF